jgi:hypothetical protein
MQVYNEHLLHVTRIHADNFLNFIIVLLVESIRIEEQN